MTALQHMSVSINRNAGLQTTAKTKAAIIAPIAAASFFFCEGQSQGKKKIQRIAGVSSSKICRIQDLKFKGSFKVQCWEVILLRRLASIFCLSIYLFIYLC